MRKLAILLFLILPASLFSQIHSVGSLTPSLIGTYGAKCDGSTDDSTAIQTFINAQTTTGGRVDFPSNKSCAFSTTITLKTNTAVYLNGSTLKWTGSNSGTLFTTDSTIITTRFGVYGPGTIDLNACATCTGFLLHTFQFVVLRDFIMTGAASGSNKPFRLLADSSTATGSIDGSAASYQLDMTNVSVGTPLASSLGVPGTTVGIEIDGGSSIVTQLYFRKVWLWGVSSRGVKITQNADTVYFDGMYIDLETAGAIGFSYNETGTPTVYAGVNSIYVTDSLVTGNMSVGGRTAVKLNASRSLHFDNLGVDRVETTLNTTGFASSYLFCSNDNTADYNCKETALAHHGTTISYPDASVFLNLGSTTGAGVPGIIFFSSGANSTFDSAIFATSGTSTPASGLLYVQAGELRYKGPDGNDYLSLNFTGIQGTFGTINISGFADIKANTSFTIGTSGPTITAGSGVPSANCVVGSLYLRSGAASASTATYNCYPANTWNAITVP